MAVDNLSACEECGYEIIGLNKNNDTQMWCVVCMKCGKRTGHYDEPDQAVAVWEESTTTEGKANKAGRKMGVALIGFVHLMYQKDTAKRVLRSLLAELETRYKEFV